MLHCAKFSRKFESNSFFVTLSYNQQQTTTMENNTRINPPAWFWVVSILALLWNLMGAAAYISDKYGLIELTAAQQELSELTPVWATAAYAFAVWGGVLGCIALLLRKRWARTLLLVSLLGVIANQVYMFFLSNTFEIYGTTEMGLQIGILIIALALVYFAGVAQKRRWLN